MPITVKASVNGVEQDVTFEPTAIPAEAFAEAVKSSGKYMPKETFEAELLRRAEGIAKNKGLRAPDELLTDKDFLAKILEANGIKPGAPADGQTDPKVAAEQIRERIDAARRDWEAKELLPLRTKSEAAALFNDKLLKRGLQRDIVQAAAAVGIKKALLRPAAAGQPSPVVAMFEQNFAYDPATDSYYVKDGEGFAFSNKPTKEQPYMTALEFFENWANNKENAEFVADTRQGGPALGAPGGGGAAGTIVLSYEQSRDSTVYREALKKVGGDASKIRVQYPGEQ